ncbi:MAG TPA: COX aromatic rich motif-containing protein [Candidatus Limnocylindria bacterium]|nr:COX aromatic rich motif-containing protein [Candidatus Limnocylindria bacterium]
MAKHKKKIREGRAVGLTFLGLIGLGLVVAWLLRGNDVILFNPKGLIATEQHRLMLTSTLIMLGFAVPVLVTLYFFAWKFRETNQKATHNPNVSRGRVAVLAFWGIPTVIMLVLASLMIPATFKLEPQDSIEAGKDPLTIQVVALRWKWLFIYPEQNIATVNYAQIPIDTPVKFELTADETPMSSFWIPHLGGQLYAMTEHVNQLNLIADTLGDYEGSAAEINGAGFAGMRFITRVSTQDDFDTWAHETKQSPTELSTPEYKNLLEPSENHPVASYKDPDPNLYSTILSKYAGSHGGSHGSHTQNAREH